MMSGETAPDHIAGRLDNAKLLSLIPDVASRQVMLCGPVPMMDDVTAALKQAGVRPRSIHTERFAY